MSLLEIDPLKNIIKLTLQTGYLKHTEKPVNLLLIAKPESGKTATMSLFQIEGTYTTNNITQSVIVDKIFPMIQNEHEPLKHLIIPDILNAIQKDKTTRLGFLNLIKSLIEEGITSLDTFHIRTNKVYNPPIKCGLITAITSDNFKGYYDPKREQFRGGAKDIWKSMGLLSRFIPFSYEYEISKISRIFGFIQKEETCRKATKEKISRKMVDVKGDPKLFEKLTIASTGLKDEMGGYGFRLQLRLQYLAKANAILNDRKKVAEEDIEAVLHLANWMNYRFNPL
jgi:hypothetical protein